jgi:HSP20 family protein
MVAQKIMAGGDQDAFHELHKLDQARAGTAAFLLDARESDSGIELTAEVAGVRDQDIEVNLDGNLLTISIERPAPDAGKRTHFSERFYGRLERSIQLPFAPDGNSVTAEVDNGVLTIRFKRVEEKQSHRIAIRGSQPNKPRESRAIGSTWEQKLTSEEPLMLTTVAGSGSIRPAQSGAVKTPPAQ